MGRKKGYDQRKIVAIVNTLVSNPDGTWIRHIARETKIHPSTVTKYVDSILKPILEDVSLGGGGKPLLRVIKLKPFVLDKIKEGKSIREVMKILHLMEKVE